MLTSLDQEIDEGDRRWTKIANRIRVAQGAGVEKDSRSSLTHLEPESLEDSGFRASRIALERDLSR